MGKLKGIFEDIEERPISINKATIDLLLKQDEPHGLIGLYSFYYYTAIWQKTNQPKSTTGYTAEGLKISTTRIRRYKATLIELGLVEEIITRTNDNKKINGHFIKVKYYKTYPTRNQQGRKTNRVDIGEGNAYRDNNINAYRDDKVTNKLDNDMSLESFFDKYTIKLIKLLQTKRKIMRRPDKKKWSSQLRQLCFKDGVKRNTIRIMFNWYKAHIGKEYVPDIRSAKSFRDKFDKLVAARQRMKEQVEQGEQKITYTKKKRSRK